MTNYELAVQVCGATKPCDHEGQIKNFMDCPFCQGTNKRFMLDERARLPCPGPVWKSITGNLIRMSHTAVQGVCEVCDGRGWLPAILLLSEPCSRHFGTTANPVRGEADPANCQDCGTCQVQRVDIDLLLILLNEANLIANLITQGESSYEVSLRQFFTDEIVAMEAESPGRALLEAAARSLRVEAFLLSTLGSTALPSTD